MKKTGLAKHPQVVIKKIRDLSEKEKSYMNSSQMSRWDENDELIIKLINKQKQEVESLKQKVNALKNKNSIMQQSFKYYDNEGQKQKLNQMIENAKKQLSQIAVKIANCEKVQQNTIPEQYYLWQKKKKMAQFNIQLNSIIAENQQERQQLKQVRENYKENLALVKEEIQFVIHQIQKVQNQFVAEDMDNQDVIDRQKMSALKDEYQAIKSTITILNQNNQILTSQLQQSLNSIQVTLKKSFQNSKNTLGRELQLIKKQIESSEPSPYSRKQNQPTSNEAFGSYVANLREIQSLLTTQQIDQAHNLIKPYDWTSFKWEQYLDSYQPNRNIDYLQKFQALSRQHEQIQKQITKIEKQIQQSVIQNIKITQQNLQIQSASNKLSKLLPNKR